MELASDQQKKLFDAIDKEMDILIDKIFAESQENLIRPHVKVLKSGRTINAVTTDTSTLMKSGNVNRGYLEKEIVYTAPYATDVEYGNAGTKPDQVFIQSYDSILCINSCNH